MGMKRLRRRGGAPHKHERAPASATSQDFARIIVWLCCLTCLLSSNRLLGRVKQEYFDFLTTNEHQDSGDPTTMSRLNAIIPNPIPLPESVINETLRLLQAAGQESHKYKHWMQQSMDSAKMADMKVALRNLQNEIPGIKSCRQSQNGLLLEHVDFCPPHNQQNDTIIINNNNNTNSQQVVLLRNPFEKTRIVCGHQIKGHALLVVSSKSTISPATWNCLMASNPYFGHAMDTQLFPVVPSEQTSAWLPPIELTDSKNRKAHPAPFQDCNVPCHATPKKGSSPSYKTVAGTDWSIVYCMEGPYYYKDLKIDPEAYKHGKFYATTSFKSEIPLPYFSFAEYPLQKNDGVNFTNAIKGAVFLARNCQSKNKREDVVRDLIASPHIRVDSVSSCLKNADPPRTAGTKKGDILRHYLFYLAFENQNEDDYITEKLWGALSDGALPVYLGGDNIKEHVPPNSVIDVKEFESTQSLAAYLAKVASNQTLYESYHTWRRHPLPKSFLDKYNFTHTHSVCRMCRWAYSKLYGLGWNHTTQSIVETKINRTMCYKSQDLPLLTTPFRESWFSFQTLQGIVDATTTTTTTTASVTAEEGVNKEQSRRVCDHHIVNGTASTTPKKRELTLLRGSLRRTAISRDGILDIFLEPTGDPVTGASSKDAIVFQLETPIKYYNDDDDDSGKSLIRRQSDHQYWLQDKDSRITLLTSQKDVIVIAAKRPQDDEQRLALQLVISHLSTPLRLRFIVEDINNFYKNGSYDPQHFASFMEEDWSKPIERFSIPMESVPAANSLVARLTNEAHMQRRQRPHFIAEHDRRPPMQAELDRGSPREVHETGDSIGTGNFSLSEFQRRHRVYEQSQRDAEAREKERRKQEKAERDTISEREAAGRPRDILATRQDDKTRGIDPEQIQTETELERIERIRKLQLERRRIEKELERAQREAVEHPTSHEETKTLGSESAQATLNDVLGPMKIRG